MIDLSAFKPKTYYTPPAASDNPLRRRRGELRLSAEEAAGRLGISLETLRTWEYRKAVPPEDARYIIPQGVTCNLIVTMNARELLHFFSLRCCNRAQWEIRALADEMLRKCREAAPELFSRAGCACMKNLPCPEGKRSCGHPRAVHKGV